MLTRRASTAYAYCVGRLGPWTRVNPATVAKQISAYVRYATPRYHLSPLERGTVERSLRRHYLRTPLDTV